MFCALAAQGRRAGNAALTCWWSERRCAALWGDLARPDGYGQWTEHTPAGPVTTDFFLEYDTGSENLHRVAAKLTGYPTWPPAPASPPPSCSGCPPPAARPPCGHSWPAPPAAAARGRGQLAGSPACPSPPPHHKPPPAAAGQPGLSGCPPGSPAHGWHWPRPAAPRPPRPPPRPQASRPGTASRLAPACPGIPPSPRHRPCRTVPARIQPPTGEGAPGALSP